MVWTFAIGLATGLFLGRCVGQWEEHRLWLDAVGGRERINGSMK